MDLPELDTFSERVYWLVGQVPRGSVASYGQIAHLAGAPRAARAVGTLMRRAKENGHEDVPWQRIINGKGGISFKGDTLRAEHQLRLLTEEGVPFEDYSCDFETYEWSPERSFWEVDW